MMCRYAPLFVGLVSLVVGSAKCREVTVFEGLSNINILCDLIEHTNEVYWKIDQFIYDLRNIPSRYTATGNEGLTLATVDRGLDGYSYQCLTIDTTSETGERLGAITRLNVIYDTSTTFMTECSLAPYPIRLDYGKMLIGTNIVWNTNENCTSDFGINYFEVRHDNNALIFAGFIKATINMITISNFTNNNYYYRIAGLDECCLNTLSQHYSFPLNGGVETIYTTLGSNVTLSLPILDSYDNLHIVWASEEQECSCPAMKFIHRCNCTLNGTVSISNNSVYFTSLSTNTKVYFEVEELFFPERSKAISIIKAVQIIMLAPPEPPEISFEATTNIVCFSSNDYNVDYYNVSTSVAELSTSLGIYSTSQCITLTPDLRLNVHGPFQVSVSAINQVGVSSSNITIKGGAVDSKTESNKVILASVIPSAVIISFIIAVAAIMIKYRKNTRSYPI